MKRLFTLLLISFAAMSCEMIDEKLEVLPDENEHEKTEVDIPHNQIWYTSVDGEVVEPYSGGYNNYADALTTFGVNIVSNTYVDGKGVIEFDGDVTKIGAFTFFVCSSLVSVTIPNSVTTIGYGAFYNCSSLESLTIPDSVTTISEEAFYWCVSLTSVTIPDSVTTIGVGAFSGCSGLQEFNGKFASEDGRCLIIDGTLISFAPAGLTEYAIPDGVTTIGNSAFYYCDNLTSITIPDSVNSIGFGAFSWCKSLTSVTIPDSVTSIGENAFVYCDSLQEFRGKFASEDGRCLIIYGVLNSFAPAGLTEYAIPDGVTTIGGSVFNGCKSLTCVTIPDSVTTIGYGAFSWCESLTSVTIPNGVTTIGERAFYYCCSLTSITIPDSVTTIGERAFYYCSSLTSVYCKAITPPVGGCDMFYNTESALKIYVPMESVEAYKSAEWWSEYADDIVGYNF